MAVAAAAGLASCQADMDTPALQEPVATMKANTTISDFKTEFADKTVKCPMKDEESQTPYIIHGRVVSSDASGNIYKSIVIQDETAAIALSVNQGSTYTDYRIGQEVVLNVTGLYIGYYNGLQQVGWFDLYNGEPSLTFMAWDLFLAHSEKNGFPNPDVQYVDQNAEWPADNPYCIVTTFSQLPSTGEAFRNMQSQLVEFRNVHFKEGGKETYAPYQESVNRTLVDANGRELIVRTSGYSNFYNETLPEGTGTVRGILSYYGTDWQLLLRGKGDVMITKKGQKEDPYTVEEAMEVENQGASGWVSAYIVGSVKAGITEVKSNSDVIFGSDAEIDNNILIAASADEKDWTKCLAVDLPQGSAFRKAVNLLDNPGVLGKKIVVSGNLSSYLGMPGITGNGGTGNDVEVEGVTIGGGSDNPPAAEGDGTKEKPYSIDYARTVTADVTTPVWVEGYVVGYIPDKSWSGAVFGNEATAGSTNYENGTNVILSQVPAGSATADNSVPVQLQGNARNLLGISKNPSVFGKKVKVLGTLEKFYGVRGIKAVNECEVGDGGGETPEPPTPGASVYEGLVENANDWTFDNVTVPEAASTYGIWQWDTRYATNQYLKASAFISNTAYESLSYAVSPLIDLTGYKSASVNFDHAARFQTTLRELCGLVVREEGASTWTALTIPTWPEAGAWTFANSGDIDLSAYAGKKIRIGFKYASSTSGADTWEVKNVKVAGSK